MKYITFSFDDGVTQDERLIEMMNRYGLKSTFNINSSLLGLNGQIVREGVTVSHNKISPNKVAKIYSGHEIAVHTLTHPNLTEQSEDAIVWQVEQDRKTLSKLFDADVVGMAYPCGGVNNDDRVAEILRRRTKIKYARTITSSYSFEPSGNLLRFNPTVHIGEYEKMCELAENFLRLNAESTSIFYIWGHSYELDYAEGGTSWEKFEDLLREISRRDDIEYVTNAQAFGLK